MALAAVPGPHPLDVDAAPGDVDGYALGRSFVERDLRLALSQADAGAIDAALCAHGVDHAYVLRDNLVNFKKVLLTLCQGGSTLGHDLRKLATFFRAPPEVADDAPEHAGYSRSSRYHALCSALSVTLGAVGSLSFTSGRKRTQRGKCCTYC